MFEYVFAAIVAYILYRFVFNFILPVYRTTKMMKQKVGEMNNFRDQSAGFHAEKTSQPQNNPSNNRAQQETTNNTKEGEYIDFEEIKD